MFSLVPFLVLFSVWGLTFENSDPETVPHWFYLLFGICYLIYRTFDETDGKQARRTGSSSPLGMLFDHGCDGFSVTFVVICSMKFLSTGDKPLSLFFYNACITMFYFPILEEYYIGGIFFGKCNPITDGAILASGMYLFLGIFGNSILSTILIEKGSLWQGNEAMDLMDIVMYSCFLVVIVNSSMA